MTEWLSAEDVTGGELGAPPSRAKAAVATVKDWVIPASVQAERDKDRMKILQSEVTDPRYDATTRAGVAREIVRAGGTPELVAKPKPAADPAWLEPEEVTGFVKPPPTLAQNLKGFVKDKQSWKDMGAGIAAFGDLVLGMPAFVAQVGATGVANIYEAVKGSPQPLKAANERMAKVMETPWMKFMLTPLAVASGANTEETTVGKVMGGITGAVENAAEYWSEKTGSTETGEGLKQAVQIAMAKGGDTFVKGFREWAQAKGKLPPEVPKAAPVAPEVVEARPVTKAYTDEVLKGKPQEAPFSEAPKAPLAEAPKPAEGAAPAVPAVEPASLSENLDPYKLPAAAAVTGAAAWAAQDKLTDEQIAGLMGVGAAATLKGPKLSGIPEPRLVEMLKQGGPSRESAAAQIYRDNVPMLTRSLRKYERQGVEIEDVIQRTMEKGLREIEAGRFSGDSAIQTYLYRIAENEALSGREGNGLRYQKTQLKTEPLDSTETPGAGKGDESRPSPHEQVADSSLLGRSPEQIALNAALGEKLTRSLDRLDPDQRRAFELSELEGLPDAAIAEQLGIPLGTVKSRISRAKDSLKQSLREYGPKQSGKVSSDLLIGTGGVVAGATLASLLSDDDSLSDRIYGALGGGLLATTAGRKVLKQAIKSPDWAFGVISTRLGQLAPPLKAQQRLHELRLAKAIDTTHDQIAPFISAFKKQSPALQSVVANELLNRKLDTINATPELAKAYPAVAGTLKLIETQLKGLGRFAEGLGDYFPRVVKDWEGLKGALNQPVREGLELALLKAESEMVRKQQRSLTPVEESIIANRYLFADAKDSHLPGFAHSRKIQEVTSKLQPFYETPVESLLQYVTGAIKDIETARFFGKDLSAGKKGQKTFNNVDESVGNITARLMEQGVLDSQGAMEVREIFRARFGPGEKAMHSGLAATRDLTNLAVLGNFASTATQLGDLVAPVYHHGLVPTLQAVVERVIGKEHVTPKQLGLVNHLAAEFAEGSTRTGHALAQVLKYTGFRRLNQEGQGLLINAGLIEAQQQIRSPKGQAAFIDKWGYAFERDMPQLLADLKTRANTPRTERLAWEMISDAQPVSRAETTQAFLEHPNGRVLGQLKSWMLKQTDIVRRDAYDNIATGEPTKIMRGVKNLAALATLYAFSQVPGDVIKDLLNGRDVDPLTTPQLVDNVLKTFGLNRYAQEKLEKGKVVEAGKDFITPPWKVIEDIAKGDERAISYLPGVGPMVYNRLFDGNEKRELAERAAAAKELSKKGVPKEIRKQLLDEKKELSEDAKAYTARKKEEARVKREAKEAQWMLNN